MKPKEWPQCAERAERGSGGGQGSEAACGCEVRAPTYVAQKESGSAFYPPKPANMDRTISRKKRSRFSIGTLGHVLKNASGNRNVSSSFGGCQRGAARHDGRGMEIWRNCSVENLPFATRVCRSLSGNHQPGFGSAVRLLLVLSIPLWIARQANSCAMEISSSSNNASTASMK